MNEPRLFRTMNELIAARLVVQESAEQFAFRHALTRDAVYTTLLLRERRMHHHTIAETLERLYADSLESILSDLAYHYYEATVWDKALEYSRRAAERAEAMYAPREAVEHLTRALEAARQLSTGPAMPTLLRGRARAYGVLGEFDHARGDYEAVLQTAQAAGDRQTEWQAQLDLGFLWAARDYAKTSGYFQQALALARALGDPAALGHTLNRVGNWYTNIERPHDALPQHLEALDIFRELNDKPGLAETVDLLGLTCILTGDWKKGIEYYEQAIALFRELDDRQGLVSALATYAERGILYYDGPFPSSSISLAEALAEGEEALKLAREIGWRSGEAYALCVLSGLYSTLGELARAFDVGRSALQIAQEIEHHQWTILALQIIGGLYLSLLDWDEAQEYLEKGLALARETRSLLFVRQVGAWLADAYIGRGESEDLRLAEEVLKAVLGTAQTWRTMGQRSCGYAYVELALARGEAAAALELLDALHPEQDEPAANSGVPRYWKLRGEALTLLNRLDDAESALSRSLRAISEAQPGPLGWQIHLAQGKVYELRRRPGQAQVEFAAARQIVERMAAAIPDSNLKSNFRTRALARIAAASSLTQQDG